MAKLKINKEVEIVNRKAAFEYKFLQTFEAGIMLTGTEVKSVRTGDVNMKDAFCFFRKGELYIKNLFIAEFKYGNINNHETRRLRKLLLKKPELVKIEKKMKASYWRTRRFGSTLTMLGKIAPLRSFFMLQTKSKMTYIC